LAESWRRQFFLDWERGSGHAFSRLALSLAKTFADNQSTPARDLDLRELEEKLGQLIELARKTWPGATVDLHQFVAQLARRMIPGKRVDEWLASVHAADLYLCCGCASGDSQSIATFEQAVLPHVVPAIAGIDSSPTFVAETKQQMRQRLLVSAEGRPPKISEYAGFGPLSHWLRAVALRTALNLRRAHNREETLAGDDQLLGLPAQVNDLELEYLKERYRKDFTEAFRKAVSILSPQERNVLRLHFIDGLSLTQVGSAYQADKSTVSRWIGKSRLTLLQRTREELSNRLRLDSKELDSLMHLVNSQLDVNISTVLRVAEDEE
jgi:RNA polymerase sigma-70 factor (ECF subfamily)